MADRILFIEDDLELGEQVVERLRRAGFVVTWWKEGRAVGEASMPDVQLAIVDLMLPGVFGLDVIKALRAFSEVPILVLSARNESEDKIRALKLGADDYMTKPFWPDELTERVRARLRRPTLHRTDRLEVGLLRIDLVSGEVHVGSERIDVTPVELRFLTALARRAGAAVSRAWLAENVLDDDREVALRTLDVHASRLRKKLRRGDLIETVFGVGYRLARRTT